jgi:hypothetical protein
MPASRLELNTPLFATRATNFAQLMSDKTFQKQFFADPGGVATRELNLTAKPAQISATNKLMFSLLADPGFVKWTHDFQQQIQKEFPSLKSAESMAELSAAVRVQAVRQKIQQEFAEGVVQHVSKQTAAAITAAGPLATHGLIVGEDDIAIVLLVFVAVIVVAVIGKVGDEGENVVLSRSTVRLITNQLVNHIATNTINAR